MQERRYFTKCITWESTFSNWERLCLTYHSLLIPEASPKNERSGNQHLKHYILSISFYFYFSANEENHTTAFFSVNSSNGPKIEQLLVRRIPLNPPFVRRIYSSGFHESVWWVTNVLINSWLITRTFFPSTRLDKIALYHLSSLMNLYKLFDLLIESCFFSP